MSAYVCYGPRVACVIVGGFACTREELPNELRRVARPAVGSLLRIETYGNREAALAVAGQYGGGAPPVLFAANHR
jgi:hypothetical protein